MKTRKINPLNNDRYPVSVYLVLVYVGLSGILRTIVVLILIPKRSLYFRMEVLYAVTFVHLALVYSTP